MLYFDHAATSYPKPPAVLRAMTETMVHAGGNPGRSAHPLSLRASHAVYAARETAAAFFSAPEPENVLFYPNATYALNTVLHGLLSEKNGAQVLYSEMEHNAVVRPLYALERQGIRCEQYPVFLDADAMLDEDTILEGIRRRIRSNTALVCACHVSNVCGACLPIRKIGALCRRMHVPFLVDASQSAGVYDIDMREDNIDYLCTAGHKALLGPQGSGLLIIGDHAAIPAALTQGGNGVASLSPAMPDFLPEALEAGTLSTQDIAGLDAGMRFLRSVGIQSVRESSFALYRRLREILMQSKGVTVLQSTIETGTTLSFYKEGVSCSTLAELLAKQGVYTRAGFHCAPYAHRAFGTMETGTIRISVGYGNHVRDADMFYRIWRQLAAI